MRFRVALKYLLRPGQNSRDARARRMTRAFFSIRCLNTLLNTLRLNRRIRCFRRPSWSSQLKFPKLECGRRVLQRS